MSTVCLPVDTHPIVSTYSHDADLLCLLESNPWKEEWILSHYGQLIYLESAHRFSFCSPVWDCPLIECKTILSEDFEVNRVIQFLCEQLQNGFYCIITMNMRYVPQSYAYGVDDFFHRIMLYGYDDQREKFQAMIHRSHYIPTEISFQQLEAGFHNARSYYFRNNQNEFSIHWNHILNDFQCYIEGNIIALDGQLAYYNLLAVKKMLELIANDYWDVRQFSTYREHKDVMLWKIPRLMKRGVKFPNPTILDELEEIRSKAQICEMLCMKVEPSNASEIAKRITSLIQEITQQEQRLIPQIMQGLAEYMGHL